MRYLYFIIGFFGLAHALAGNKSPPIDSDSSFIKESKIAYAYRVENSWVMTFPAKGRTEVAPKLKKLNAKQTTSLKNLLLSKANFEPKATFCVFEPGVAFRFQKGSKFVDVFYCFKCAEIQVPSGKIHSFKEHSQIIKLSKELFKKDRAIQGLKNR